MTPFATAVAAYYGDPQVRARLLEYCGATDIDLPSAAFIAALDPAARPYPTWEHGARVPCDAIDVLSQQGCDLARSLWDTRVLMFALDLDYQGVDYPSEPFTHASDVFFKLESAYAAVRSVLKHLNLHALIVATGRGYHFVGQIPLDDRVVDELARLAPVPAWYDGVERRRPPGVNATMSERQARASMGLTLVLEYLAHAVLRHAAQHTLIPVVVNGTPVGSGLVGRECVSLDFSHGGDPLDVRHIRMAFSAYQWHLARPDIFGEAAAMHPPLATVPRHQRSLTAFLLAGRDLESARRIARRSAVVVPDVSRGVERAIDHYRRSLLARFHAGFIAGRAAAEPVPAVPNDLPPCITQPLLRPNDLLLKPEFIQNLVRGLLARGWNASQIAALVEREYRRDHGWGDRWARLDARTRADFDVRVFAGLVTEGVDQLIDFNCTSSQEKHMCPIVECHHDLRDDRRRLAERYAS